MYESILLASFSALGLYSSTVTLDEDNAFSDEAKNLRKNVQTRRTDIENSRLFLGKKESAINDLYELAIECSEPNWDGYGANPINLSSVFFAEKFIRNLPDRYALPEFAADPDGEVSLDWQLRPYHVLSISISPSGSLAFSCIRGSSNIYGAVRYSGGLIPQDILTQLDLLYEGEKSA